MNSIFFLNFILFFKYFYLILKKLNQIDPQKKKKKMQFNITKTVLYSSIQEEYK